MEYKIFLLLVTIQLVQSFSLVEPNGFLNQKDSHHISNLEDAISFLNFDTKNEQYEIAENNIETDKKDQDLSMPQRLLGTLTSFSNGVQYRNEFQCNNTDSSNEKRFSYYDYAIVGGMLIVSLGIGVFYGFFHSSGSTSDDFLLGSGMSLIPVSLSLTTSFITAIELLGNPSEMFYLGTQFSIIVLPMVLVIPVAVKIFYPIYFKLDLTSCYEYLGIRFGKDIRLMGSILYIIQMSFYTSVAVLAPAIALSKATGLNTRIAVALIYLVCIFYSSQGGMKAVVIADTFQACVLALSLVLIVILGHFYTGNGSQIIETSANNDRLEFFNFDPNPTTRHTVFSIVIGGFFYWTSLFCTNQASVQKCMSLKSLKLAKLALGFAVTGLIIVFLITFYTGLMVYTHYSGCDPLSSGRIEATDQLLPFYIMDVYGHIPTVNGIYVAGIFAASLGTVASALNSLSAVTCEDILINGFNFKIDSDKGATYAKWMSLSYGILSFVLVFIVEMLGGVLQATLTLNGLIGGVTLGLFVLGIGFKKANQRGAFYGAVLSLLIVIYIGVMAQITNVEPNKLPVSVEKCNCTIAINSKISLNISNYETLSIDEIVIENEGYDFSSIYRISYMWYSMLGAMLTIIFGLIISFISDAVEKSSILEITKRRDDIENNIKDKFKQKNPLKWHDQPQSLTQKIGFDNLALKIDDEKY